MPWRQISYSKQKQVHCIVFSGKALLLMLILSSKDTKPVRKYWAVISLKNSMSLAGLCNPHSCWWTLARIVPLTSQWKWFVMIVSVAINIICFERIRYYSFIGFSGTIWVSKCSPAWVRVAQCRPVNLNITLHTHARAHTQTFSFSSGTKPAVTRGWTFHTEKSL